MSAVVSVAVSGAQCLLVGAGLCLGAAERPQWPRLYLLSRPRSRGRMPSLVSDHGQVLRVLGWALIMRSSQGCPFQG